MLKPGPEKINEKVTQRGSDGTERGKSMCKGIMLEKNLALLKALGEQPN